MKKYIIYITIIVASFLATSCCVYPDCDQGMGEIDFVYINNTGYEIEIVSESEGGIGQNIIKHNGIKKGTAPYLDLIIDKNDNIEKSYKEWFLSAGVPTTTGRYSTTIKFNNEKCLKYSNRQYKNEEYTTRNANNCINKRSVYCYDNYKVTQVGEEHYRYEYTFTEEDYKMAKPCEELEKTEEK